jgi:hypothetical protein
MCLVAREWVVRTRGLRVGFSMSLMRVAANFLGSNGGAAVGRSLTALTALQTLHLACKVPCFVVVMGDLFYSA